MSTLSTGDSEEGDETPSAWEREPLAGIEEDRDGEQLAILANLDDDGPAVVHRGDVFADVSPSKADVNRATRVLSGGWRQWRHRSSSNSVTSQSWTELRNIEREGSSHDNGKEDLDDVKLHKFSSQAPPANVNPLRRRSSVWDTDSFFSFGILPTGNYDEQSLLSTSRQRVGFKEFAVLFFRDSAFHGVPKIVQKGASRLQRIFWLLLFLTASAVLLYQTAVLISNYLGYEYQVDVQFNFNKELNFPAVTFCNLSPLRRNSLECSRFDPNRTDPFSPCSNASVASDAAAANNISVSQLHQQFVLKQFVEALSDAEGGFRKRYDFNQPHPTKEEYATFGFRLEDMLIRCLWKGQPCSHRNFTITQNSFYGNCFSLNVDKTNVLKTSQPGPSFGLSLELFIDPNEELREKSTSSGIRMSLHQVGVKPFPEEDGFSLSPGFSTSIGVRQLQVNRLGEPYGNCTDAKSEWDSLYPGYDYSRTACLKSCLAKTMFAMCGCVEWMFLVGKPLCKSKELNFTEASCIERVREDYRTNQLRCTSCYNPCVDKVYRNTISLAAWPSTYYQKEFKNELQRENFTVENIPAALFRERYLRVEIYFEELNYENIIQKPSYEVENLLADIGGQVGLWIGLSILAFLEVVEFLVYILLVAMGKVKMPLATLDDQ